MCFRVKSSKASDPECPAKKNWDRVLEGTFSIENIRNEDCLLYQVIVSAKMSTFRPPPTDSISASVCNE